MKKHKLKILEFFIATIFFVSAAFYYLEQNAVFENLNNKISDVFFNIRGTIKPSDNIVIVDIDEESLRELGQWPWSRNIVSQILQNLTNAGVGIIGLDIVFAEADKSSPRKVCTPYVDKSVHLKDYDNELARTLANTPTITGYIFDFLEETNRGVLPNISAIIIQKNFKDQEYLPIAKGIISNIKILQDNSYSSGFFNTLPDMDGIVRNVPLLAKYHDGIYPSLSLEILRIIYQTNKITLNYSEAGIASINLASKNIPTDRFGRLMVNYYGNTKTFSYISAVDVYNNNFDKNCVDGKIVLIGTSASGLVDLRATPIDSTFAGVEIHATVIENILSQNYLVKPDYIDSVNLLAIFILLFFITILFIYFGALVSAFFSLFFLSAYLYVAYYMFVSQGIVLNVIYPLVFGAILYMVLSSLHYFIETKQKELIRKSFSRKVSTQVMEDLLREDHQESLATKESEVSIYFSDIRSFTNISEKLHSPKKITEFLNYYMTQMVAIIENNRGTIDKFIGDAIMAYWNAPLRVENHADKAVKSALLQLEKREKIADYTERKYGFRIDFGIGINTGKVVVGEIGSLGRSDYTVIGDAVNLASRLEGLCKVYNVRLIISEFTKNALREEYVLQLLDIVRVKGKEEPVKIYELLYEGQATQKSKEELSMYDTAHQYYINSEFLQAQKLFQILYTKYDKYLYKLYEMRCISLQKDRPKNFDGVFEFTTK